MGLVQLENDLNNYKTSNNRLLLIKTKKVKIKLLSYENC